MVLMIALLLFISWDKRRTEKSISQGKISKSFILGSTATWPGFLGLALAGFLLAFNEFLNPSVPPFTGKGSTMKTLAYEALGEQGIALLWLLMGAAFVVAACVSYRSISHRKSGEAYQVR